MTSSLALRNNDLPTPETWQTMLSMADHLVQSGMLPKHITTPAAAVAIIQRGRELGIPPMYALNNIVYIQGKATTNSELMLALIYRDHGDGAVVFARTDNTACEIHYRRRGWPTPQRFVFSIEDAKQAGLMSNQTWQKYPAAMLRARAISAVARMAFPDTIGGMYTPEELGANVELDREGAFVIVHDEPPPSVDVATGEIIEADPWDEPQEDTVDSEAYERIVSALKGPLTTGAYNLLLREIEQLGISDVPEISILMTEVEQRRAAAAQERRGVARERQASLA